MVSLFLIPVTLAK